MRRRAFIGALGGAAAWPFTARGQVTRVPRVGVLVGTAPPCPLEDALRKGLHALGYAEGRNIALDEVIE